jgi:hypothetical protein
MALADRYPARCCFIEPERLAVIGLATSTPRQRDWPAFQAR